MTSRNWCLTINNPTVSDNPHLLQESQLSNVKLLIYQLEMGENETPHIQGYLELKNPIRLTGVKAMFPRAHVEPRKGTRGQAVNYVIKQDTRLSGPECFVNNEWLHTPENALLFGQNLVKQSTAMKGTASSMKSILSKIKSELCSGESTAIENIADEYFEIWIRYHRAFDRYLLMKSKPRNSPTEVIVLCGPSGTGKSKWAMDQDQSAYWKQRSNWWDGYLGQTTVVLDEFYGWLPYDTLLRLCDRYPLYVETKGGQTNFSASKIIITSNKHPREWYKNVYFEAFKRRVSSWHVLPTIDIHLQFEKFDDFDIHMINFTP